MYIIKSKINYENKKGFKYSENRICEVRILVILYVCI